MSALHEVTAGFDAHDPFLHGVLGAIALLRRLRPACAALPEPVDAEEAGPAPGDVDEQVLYAALGLIAASQRLFAHRTATRRRRAGVEGRRAPRSDAPRPRPRELLR